MSRIKLISHIKKKKFNWQEPCQKGSFVDCNINFRADTSKITPCILPKDSKFIKIQECGIFFLCKLNRVSFPQYLSQSRILKWSVTRAGAILQSKNGECGHGFGLQQFGAFVTVVLVMGASSQGGGSRAPEPGFRLLCDPSAVFQSSNNIDYTLSAM